MINPLRSSPAARNILHLHLIPPVSKHCFSTTQTSLAKNRIYDTIRRPSELDTLTLLSASSRVPLLTLFTASWCSSCKAVLPIIRGMIEDEGVGEEEGSVSFAEVEFDAPENGELGMRYMITSIPTLMAFSRQEAQVATKVTRVEELKDREFLKRWIENEARRGGQGGAGGKSLFSGLFGKGS